MNYAKCLSILYLFLFINSNGYSMINNYNIDYTYDNAPAPAAISNIDMTNNKNNDKEEKNPRVVINKFNNNKANTEAYKLLELRKKAYQASSGKYVQVNEQDKKLFNMIKDQNNKANDTIIQKNVINNNANDSEAYKLLELRKKAYQASSGKYIQVNEQDKKLFNMIKDQINSDNFSTQIALYKNRIINKYKASNNKDTAVKASNIHTISSTNESTRNNKVKNTNSIYVCA